VRLFGFSPVKKYMSPMPPVAITLIVTSLAAIFLIHQSWAAALLIKTPNQDSSVAFPKMYG